MSTWAVKVLKLLPSSHFFHPPHSSYHLPSTNPPSISIIFSITYLYLPPKNYL